MLYIYTQWEKESYRSCNVYTQRNREFETRLVAQLLHPRHGGRYFSDLYLLQTTEALPLATVEEKQFQTPGPLICFAHYFTGELAFRTVAATCVSGGEITVTTDKVLTPRCRCYGLLYPSRSVPF